MIVISSKPKITNTSKNQRDNQERSCDKAGIGSAESTVESGWTPHVPMFGEGAVGCWTFADSFLPMDDLKFMMTLSGIGRMTSVVLR